MKLFFACLISYARILGRHSARFCYFKSIFRHVGPAESVDVANFLEHLIGHHHAPHLIHSLSYGLYSD